MNDYDMPEFIQLKTSLEKSKGVFTLKNNNKTKQTKKTNKKKQEKKKQK